jgi:hypothetical protein
VNAKREKVTKFILDNIAKITPGDSTNVDLLRSKLNAFSDKEFEAYLRKLAPAETPEQIKQREILPFYVPNLGKTRISIARNFKIVKGLGKSLTHRLVMTDGATGLQYVTPHPYPVLDLPVRRQAQTVVKKRSIPEHDQRIDDLTGQPTSQSKGSRVSAPELGSLSSRGLDNTIMEKIKVRGGDEAAYREMRRNLIENGECSLDQVSGLGHAKSIDTMSVFFNCMHLGNNMKPETKVPEDAYAKAK